jgi:hypothetical protein
MAARGAKPKPAHLRLVDGTHRKTRHGDSEKAREKAERVLTTFGKLERPKFLKGHALSAWKQFIEPATWLDAVRRLAEKLLDYQRNGGTVVLGQRA